MPVERGRELTKVILSVFLISIFFLASQAIITSRPVSVIITDDTIFEHASQPMLFSFANVDPTGLDLLINGEKEARMNLGDVATMGGMSTLRVHNASFSFLGKPALHGDLTVPAEMTFVVWMEYDSVSFYAENLDANISTNGHPIIIQHIGYASDETAFSITSARSQYVIVMGDGDTVFITDSPYRFALYKLSLNDDVLKVTLAGLYPESTEFVVMAEEEMIVGDF